MKILNIFIFVIITAVASASLSGPFLFWGHEKINDIHLPALSEASEQSLATLFKEAKAVIVFIRNNTNLMDTKNYPKLKDLTRNNTWAFIQTQALIVEPFDYNANVEVVNLNGQPSQQDDEIVSSYEDSVTIYGEGEVLGIVANRDDEVHYVSKREAKEGESTPTTTSGTPTDEPTERDFIYRAEGKAILYTTTAPILNLDIDGTKHSFELMEHDKEIAFDDRTEWSRLNIGFKVNNVRLRLRFNFTITSSSYWALKTVEVEYKEYRNSLPVVGNEYTTPTAPRGFSYRCSSKSLIFRNGEDNLTISDYQVQPWLKGANSFSEAYDCVGFTTVPIWSGIFITLFLIGVLSIAILAIMDIKPPNRFENSRGKQITFVVQE